MNFDDCLWVDGSPARTAGLQDRTQTESLCPVCLQRLPARRILEGEDVHLVKTCPSHGTFRTVIWRGKPAFARWQRSKITVPVPETSLCRTLERGCPYDCGLCPDHRQRSCTVIIEVTQRCDLACPVCYADAPSRGSDPSPDFVAGLYHKAVRAAPGSNIQLSGGEPTLRNDLPLLVAMGRESGFDFIQVNTNGVRLGRDRAFVKALKQAGLASVFLQFDGLDDDVYRRLRGRSLMAAKRAAIEACAEEEIGVVLVPTLVPGVNTRQIGAILQAALSWMPVVRGVHFQPVSYFGRYEAAPDEAGRITLPEVMRAIEEQSEGRIRVAHLRPPGCENALCSFHGRYLQRSDGQMVALNPSAGETCCTGPEKADEGATRAISAVARQWAGPVRPGQDALPSGTCGCSPAGKRTVREQGAAPMSLDDFIQRAQTHTFSISAMAFQDAWTLTLDRVRDCCIHVMAPDGRLIPFCLYNLTAVDGRRLYRP